MPRRRIRTSKRAIAEYWLGTQEGRARLPGNAALMDFGEPSCFACGWMAADPDLEPDIWRVWDHASLQRCHLVPDALGGPDTSENLVLLCARCHSEAPDVADAEYMLRWIDEHESWGRLVMSAVTAALEHHGVSEHEIQAFNGLEPDAMMALTGCIIRDWAIPVGGRLSYATLAACAVEGVRRASQAEA